VSELLDRARGLWRHRVAGPVIKIALAYFVGLQGAVQFLFGQVPLLHIGLKSSSIPQGVFLFGIVIGSLYGLVAAGLILVYRANRIINFAQAEIGAVPAVFVLIMMSKGKIPYAVALPTVIVLSAAVGFIVEFVFMRRFRTAPRLIVTVATIGVAELLAFIEFYVPIWVSGKTLPPSDFPSPFKHINIVVGIVRFTGDHVAAVVLVAILMGGLAAFFRFTDMGIAVRASAENGERASLLGIPVKRVSTVVWVLAAVLSGLGLFMRAPVVGLPIGGLIGPSVLLFGLGAAVIGRMESLPTALAAAVCLGVLDQAAVYSTRRSSLAEAVILFVILGALLVQRGALSRAQDAATSTWQTVREFRPVPRELENARQVVAGRVSLAVLVLVAAVGLPLISGNIATRMNIIVIYAIVGVSLVILTGWAGQISLGQFAFTGVGAAVAGGLAANHHTDFFLTLLLAGLAGAAAAVLIGLPAVRIQGLFLAVTTLAFSFTVENIVLNRTYVPWLLPKDFTFAQRPLLYGRISVMSDTRFYYVCLVILALVLLAAHSLRTYRSGRVLIGMRDNTRSMQAYGVNPARTRLAAFAISGFVAAIAGALLVYQNGSVVQLSYAPTVSLDVFAMVVIGGLTSLTGAVLGAVYVIGIPLLLGNYVRNIDVLSTGVGLLFLLLFLPGGLSEGLYRLRDSFLRRVARSEGIHVPSLIADSLVQDSEEADQAVVEAEESVESAATVGASS
jgi:branched-chain amino acid transport system permease protein